MPLFRTAAIGAPCYTSPDRRAANWPGFGSRCGRDAFRLRGQSRLTRRAPPRCPEGRTHATNSISGGNPGGAREPGGRAKTRTRDLHPVHRQRQDPAGRGRRRHRHRRCRADLGRPQEATLPGCATRTWSCRSVSTRPSHCSTGYATPLPGKGGSQDGATVSCTSTTRAEVGFKSASIREVAFPAQDAGSKEPASLLVKIASQQMTTKLGIQCPDAAPPRGQRWLAANFRLELPGLGPTDMVRIDPFVVKAEVPDVDRFPGAGPPPGSLIVTFPEPQGLRAGGKGGRVARLA